MKNQIVLRPVALAAAVVMTILAAGCSTEPAGKDGLRQRDTALSMGTKVVPVEGGLQADGVRGTASYADEQASLQSRSIVGRKSAKPFLGATMVPSTTEDRLPPVFREPFTLDFSDARSSTGGVSLQIAMARLSRLSGVPIRISSDVTAAMPAGGQARIGAAQQVPGGGMPSPVLTNAVPGQPMQLGGSSGLPLATPSVQTQRQLQVNPDAVVSTELPTLDAVEMRYQGTLAGYLQMVTDRLGLSWEYRDSTIIVSRFVSELHEVAALEGDNSFDMSSSATGSGSAGSNGAGNSATSSMQVGDKGKIDPVASIQSTLQAMVSNVPGSSVTRSEGSGRFLVVTSREMQSRVRDYISKENAAMRRQAQIQFDIYSVTTDYNDQHGVNWSAVLQSASDAVGATITSPTTLTGTSAGGMSLSVLSGVTNNKWSKLFGGSDVLLNMLTEDGYTAQHRPISLLAMNRRFASLGKLSTQAYVSKTTPGVATTTGAGAPGLETSDITTGDKYVVMPQILDDSSILLRFGMSMSDLLSLTDVTSGSGETLQKVQTPNVSAVNLMSPISLRPGEVVAVTGLSRETAVDSKRTLGAGVPIGLGGSRSIERKREHFLVLIRAVLL